VIFVSASFSFVLSSGGGLSNVYFSTSVKFDETDGGIAIFAFFDCPSLAATVPDSAVDVTGATSVFSSFTFSPPSSFRFPPSPSLPSAPDDDDDVISALVSTLMSVLMATAVSADVAVAATATTAIRRTLYLTHTDTNLEQRRRRKG